MIVGVAGRPTGGGFGMVPVRTMANTTGFVMDAVGDDGAEATEETDGGFLGCRLA